MTTKVTVFANHGWPVDVIPVDPEGGRLAEQAIRVAAGKTRESYVHDAHDLLIHEVQPAEIADEIETEAGQ
ncbi:MAG: hypothetical protein ACOY4T_11850 [Pseudomonadota bacterium]